ncbi:hypothetical protein M514_00043 [Trichuris suis]|uniref:Transmembrane protein n=1 Tax=Trichuris suis TaxID=68888 RepID=A0A085NTV8_9BILA|nr:hypothetical protein M514_00043 [Trichuris suis]
MPRSVVVYVIGFSRRTESACSSRSTKKCRLASSPFLPAVHRRLIDAEHPDCLGLVSKTLLVPLCPSLNDKVESFASYSPVQQDDDSAPISDLLFGEQAVSGGCTPATCSRFGGAGPIATSWYFLNNLFCCSVVLLLLLLVSSLMVVSDAVEAPLLPGFANAMQSSARNTELERRRADSSSVASSSTTPEPHVSSCRMLPTQRRAEQLCSLAPRVRLQQLRHLHWSGGVGAGARCPDLTSDLSLYHLFQLNVLNEAAVLEDHRSSARRQLDHLSDSVIDCVLGPARSKACVKCFEALFRRLRLVDHVFGQFSDAVMASLSCESGGLDRFSAVTTCTDCQVWYKRWLLATFTGIWRLPLCDHWCHMVELACPHLSVRRRYDYAGLPSFRCAGYIEMYSSLRSTS